MKKIIFILFVIIQSTSTAQQFSNVIHNDQKEYFSEEAGDNSLLLNDKTQNETLSGKYLLIGDYKAVARMHNSTEAGEIFLPIENDHKISVGHTQPDEDSPLNKSNNWGTVKWISIASTAALGGVSYYFEVKAQDNYDNYNKATTTAESLDYRNKSDDCRQMRDILLYSATVTATAAIFSWIMQEL